MTDTALPDTPRSSFGALQRRATIITVAVLLGLAAAAWWSTVGRSSEMSSMTDGLAGVGRGMPFDIEAIVFLGMWVTMMVAMMFPTIAPIVLLHRAVVHRRGEGAMPTISFALGYLIVWTAVGVIPLAVLIGFRRAVDPSPWLDRAGGTVLVLAGLYQFTRWKEACLRACRTPLSFLMTHDFGSGARGALKTGVSHGLYCFGCCWALMAVLFVVGLMNIVWMAAIAVVFLAEKNWRRGVGLTRFVGIAVVTFGLAVVIHPSILGSVVNGGGASMTDGSMMGIVLAGRRIDG